MTHVNYQQLCAYARVPCLREDIDGYSHAYWGWGQEDDDLGARLTHAKIKHAKPFDYHHPGVNKRTRRMRRTSEEVEEVTIPQDPTLPCTGRVHGCDHDPSESDCGVYPYSRLKRMFRPTPARILEGLALPPSRSLVEGTCFVHAHEGGFSRDAIEDHPDLQARTSQAFQEGRRWGDVVAGRFRRDETTGLTGLVPKRCRRRKPTMANTVDNDDVETRYARGVAPPRLQPAEGHGFAVIDMERVAVEVVKPPRKIQIRDVGGGGGGVAQLAGVSTHPTFSMLKGKLAKNRWSGNDFLDKACDGAALRLPRHRQLSSDQQGSSYTRLRVRFTCDEDVAVAPWCREKTKTNLDDRPSVAGSAATEPSLYLSNHQHTVHNNVF